MKLSPGVIFAAVLLILAFAFQGSRGIWEPDEGFYTNVTLGMMNSGDLIVPRLNGDPFLDKPPLTYWGMSGGMALLGRNEWGARAFHALMFLVAALATAAAASRLWGVGTGQLAGFIYATSLAPFVAGNILTPDMPLAGAAACLLAAYLGTMTRGGSILWWVATGVAGGAGLLAKGPAILVFAAPVAMHASLRAWHAIRSVATGESRMRAASRALAGPALGALLAIGIGASWYGLLFLSIPGSFTYVLDNQVVGRLLTATYERNAAPLNALIYYPPIVFLGALPWALFLPGVFVRAARRTREAAGGGIGLLGREALRGLASGSPESFLVLAIVVPFAILSVASSRLPLYVLPLCGPLALLESRALQAWLSRATAAWRPRAHACAAALLCIALTGVKGAGALVDRPNDTRVLAGLLSSRLAGIPHPLEVVSVDTKRNALPFYGFTNFKWVTSKRDPYPFFIEPTSLESEIAEAHASDERHAFLVEARSVPDVSRDLREAGVRCTSAPIFDDESLILCEPGRSPADSGSEAPDSPQAGI